MKRRIFLSLVGLILLSTLLLSALLSLLVYNSARTQEIASVKDRATLIADLLNGSMTEDTVYVDHFNHSPSVARMTIIAPDGVVLLDNKAYAASMDNHGDRVEVIAAQSAGVGEDLRPSITLGDETFYFAVRLNNGDVLRVSKTMDSIAGVFTSLLPAVLVVTALILLLAAFAAHRLTKRIIKPLDSIDLDGEEFDGENAAVYDELIPYAKKIESQKREISSQIATLKNRADTIEAITGSMTEGLLLIDNNGGVLTANNSMQRIFGNVAHKNVIQVCRDLEFQRGVTRCLAGENVELSLKRDNRVYSVFLNPVYNDQAISGAVILFLDTTEKFLAEQQRREFSANVSHELKTPLTTISALSEMIENDMMKEGDAKGFAARISEQAKRLFNMIDDIIRLSEFDEGSIIKDKAIFDLKELAQGVIHPFKENAKGVNIRLTGESLHISANPRMIDELLFNLIDNSIKYNRDGGAVTVNLSHEDGYNVISVSDTGIGIPEKHRERVFERFYRVDKSRSKKTGGTGLGLSIVKNITEHHGGYISINSVEGEGTTVICRIPA